MPATGWSFNQRNPTECGVSESDFEPSILRRPWSARGCCGPGEKFSFVIFSCHSPIILLSKIKWNTRKQNTKTFFLSLVMGHKFMSARAICTQCHRECCLISIDVVFRVLLLRICCSSGTTGFASVFGQLQGHGQWAVAHGNYPLPCGFFGLRDMRLVVVLPHRLPGWFHKLAIWFARVWGTVSSLGTAKQRGGSAANESRHCGELIRH
jgi:hypothetical protein